MITKIPLRVARTLLPMNYSGLRLNIPQSIIEKNHLYQLIENDILFETQILINQSQNSEQTDFKGFKVQEFAEELRLELSRTVGNVQILICIDSQFFEPNIEQDIPQIQIVQIQSSIDNVLTNSQKYNSNSVPFSVYLTKGNGIISCYECSALQNNIRIDMIQIIDDITEHKMIPRQERGIYEFDGSNNNLQDSIQQEMKKYLQTFGIDSELACFIENLRNDKEQTIYMNWLQYMLSYH